MARLCPDCKTPLSEEEILGVTLDVCPDCAGIWFEDGELLKLRELGDVELDEVEDAIVPGAPDGKHMVATARLCPTCQSAMDEFVYLYTTKVKLDSCDKCYGTWVDDGELTAMRIALEESRLQPENAQVMRMMHHQLEAIELEDKHREFLTRHQTVAKVMRALTFRRASVG